VYYSDTTIKEVQRKSSYFFGDAERKLKKCDSLAFRRIAALGSCFVNSGGACADADHTCQSSHDVTLKTSRGIPQT
jgi:hypothetical protein